MQRVRFGFNSEGPGCRWVDRSNGVCMLSNVQIVSKRCRDVFILRGACHARFEHGRRAGAIHDLGSHPYCAPLDSAASLEQYGHFHNRAFVLKILDVRLPCRPALAMWYLICVRYPMACVSLLVYMRMLSFAIATPAPMVTGHNCFGEVLYPVGSDTGLPGAA